nr:DNA mismatch repair protein MutS [uncultured Caproiciproducens sp.]
MNSSEIILEYDQIKKMLCNHALSERARIRLAELSPYMDENECRRKMAETTASRKILDACGTPPLTAMTQVDQILALCQAGSMLVPEQLLSVVQFILSCNRIKSYLKKAETLDGTIACYGNSMVDLSRLRQEIERCVRNEQVDSGASSALRDVRRKVETVKAQVQTKLNDILRSKKQWFSDDAVVTRNGQFTLPVKKEYKNQFPGSVLGISGTGGTYFMEPVSVAKLQEELSSLQIEEENEVRKILYTLTSLVDENRSELMRNVEAMETLDVVFAKAKLSAQMDAVPVSITADRKIFIQKGRHPLIDGNVCVPLDFESDGGCSGVVITGPNTGGKTVALKTVGLLSMMAQSGLHIPADTSSILCMHNAYLCDIGDGQSIAENLSTFSAHMTNIIEILRQTTRESLVLLDELGSGTDPAEGMGIAIAVLDELRVKGCLFIATTHYPEVKDYADSAPGMTNARMAFDRETLQPTYRLELGKAGESCALYIAKRLGLPSRLLERAYQEAYPKKEQNSPIPDLQPDFGCKNTEPSALPTQKIQKSKPTKTVSTHAVKFQLGDSVLIYPEKKIGVVFHQANEHGEIGVQVKGEKEWISHKRLKLKTSASDLYPPDYDFSIVFDTVSNRKARHVMEKRHDPNLIIQYDEEEIK